MQSVVCIYISEDSNGGINLGFELTKVWIFLITVRLVVSFPSLSVIVIHVGISLALVWIILPQ